MHKKRVCIFLIALVASSFAECFAQSVQETLGKASFAHSMHQYAEAESLYNEALQNASSTAQEIYARKGLGMLALNQGKGEEAVSNFKKAADLESALPHPDPSLLSATLTNLGLSYSQLSRYSEAEQAYNKAKSLAQEANDKQSEATVLNHLSAIYRHQSKFPQADAASQKALSLAEEGWGKEDVNTAAIRADRGFTLGFLGRYRESESELKAALSTDERLLGVENNNVAGVAAHLARVYLTQGRLKEAETLYTRSIATRTSLIGKDDIGVSDMQTFLSRAYLEDGNIEKAKEIAEAALSSAEKTLGANNPGTWYQLVALSNVYERKGDTTKALELANRALAIYRGHKILVLLAKINKDKGDFDNAEKFAREAVKTCQRQFGPDHPELAKCLLELADVLKAKHSLSEASEMEKRANQINEKIAKLNAR